MLHAKISMGDLPTPTILFANWSGLRPAEVVGRTDHDLFPADVADKYRGDDLWVIKTGQVFEDVEENPAGGQTRYCEVRKTPVRSDSEQIVGVQIVFWDVTQRIQTQHALREAKETAESANRAKGEFVANVSHEIRTPLNAVLGMTEILLNTDLDATQRDYLSMVRDSGETLLALINDVLDFSKIEVGRLTLDKAPFDLAESLGTTMKILAVRAQNENVEFVFRVGKDVPTIVIGDPLRLRQIVTNLVGNAIKFTEHGEISLTVDCESRERDKVRLNFRVTDSGIGIPAADQGRIFGAFEQADSSTTRRFGGTGLGLAIASKLVRAMNGHIIVESDVGKGSCFHFTTTFGVPEGQSEPQPVHDLAGCNVLVVDDNQTNRETIAEAISQYGARVVQANRGTSALDEIKKADDSPSKFDLVVADIAMPNMSGYELVKQIRAEHHPNPKIIVMTTGVGREDLRWCQEMQVSAHLLKPIKRSELHDAIGRTMTGRASCDASEPTAPIPPHAAVRPLNILVAEDSPVNQKLAIGLLERENHRVTVASNGHEAVQAVQNQTFDIVLMDIQMPSLDGIAATEMIRKMEANSGTHVPIIAMTAHAMPSDRIRCLNAGMDGYVTKPIRVKALYQEMAPFLP